ncbi:MAG: response regulator transcription factor [Clostridia bacterium]
MILCVEDDVSICELLKCALEAGGNETRCANSAQEFYQILKETKPSLILLDIMLPDESGMDILKKLKADNQYKDLPIIMLTAKSSELDKVQGLESGADDFITKPFGVMELLSRVKAVLRRATPSKNNDTITYKGLVLNTEMREATIDGALINLTYKEYELLHFLLLNIGMALSRDKIIENVWGYDYEGESRTIDMHIKTLRQKIIKASGNNDINIITVRGVGYKLEKIGGQDE